MPAPGSLELRSNSRRPYGSARGLNWGRMLSKLRHGDPGTWGCGYGNCGGSILWLHRTVWCLQWQGWGTLNDILRVCQARVGLSSALGRWPDWLGMRLLRRVLGGWFAARVGLVKLLCRLRGTY